MAELVLALGGGGVKEFAHIGVLKVLQKESFKIDATSRMIAELWMHIDKPEVIIRPQAAKFGLLDNVDTKELIALGKAAADAAIPEIRQVLSWANQLTRYFRRSHMAGKVFEGDAGNRSPLTDL